MDPPPAGYANSVGVELDFSAAGAKGLAVGAVGARRGNIWTGEGGDSVVRVAHSAPTVGPDNAMAIIAGAGTDNVAVTAVSRSGTDQPFARCAEWNGAHDGRAPVSRIDLGAGIDTAAFDGPASRSTASALADGSTCVADTTGALGPSIL